MNMNRNRDLHKFLDDMLNENRGVSGDVLRADHLTGYRNVNRDGNLHLAGTLGKGGLNDTLDDLVYGG